jgi:tetratricopeptide (TPR) repeat protein
MSPVEEAPSADQRRIDSDSPGELPPFSSPEIATPTLAEVYFAQGQVAEAIVTYQRVLDRNPGAEQPRKRLEELKAMLPSVPRPQESRREEDPLRSRKEKLIRVLETWREAIAAGSKQ